MRAILRVMSADMDGWRRSIADEVASVGVIPANEGKRLAEQISEGRFPGQFYSFGRVARLGRYGMCGPNEDVTQWQISLPRLVGPK